MKKGVAQPGFRVAESLAEGTNNVQRKEAQNRNAAEFGVRLGEGKNEGDPDARKRKGKKGKTKCLWGRGRGKTFLAKEERHAGRTPGSSCADCKAVPAPSKSGALRWTSVLLEEARDRKMGGVKDALGNGTFRAESTSDKKKERRQQKKGRGDGGSADGSKGKKIRLAKKKGVRTSGRGKLMNQKKRGAEQETTARGEGHNGVVAAEAGAPRSKEVGLRRNG